jgi:hypothetical protein
MNKSPVKRNEDGMKDSNRDNVKVIPPEGHPFFSFRYSYKQVSCVGGKTYIKAKENRFEGGKFESEEFEGTTDQGVYVDAVRETQKYLLNQTALYLKQLSFFLPFSINRKDG